MSSIEPGDEIQVYDHSNESYLAVLSCGAVYYAVQGGSNQHYKNQQTQISEENFYAEMLTWVSSLMDSSADENRLSTM